MRHNTTLLTTGGIYLFTNTLLPIWFEFSQNFMRFRRLASRENVKTFK